MNMKSTTILLLVQLIYLAVGERKQLLIGGMFPMSGGWAGGIGCRPATELALHDVNNNLNVLTDYELVLTAVDSKCMPGLSLKEMYGLLYDNRTKLVLLTGCSSVSTFIAQAAKMWNLTVLSYGSSSPALSDKNRFPTFFRTHPSATLNNPTRLMLFKHFKWRRIATIQQTEEVFTSTIKDLEEVIKADSSDQPIEITVRQSFQTDPTNAVRSLKRQDARIIVGVFYEDMARKVFCQAYKEKLYGKKYVWLIIGWYPDHWYKKDDPDIDCTPEQLRVALEGHLTTEVLQYNTDQERVTDTGITTKQFKDRLRAELRNETGADDDPSSYSSLAGFVEAPLAYDAIWALTFALEKAIKEFSQPELKPYGLSLENFTYDDIRTKNIILSALNRTDFEGVSGRVSFTSSGDRIAKTQIEQMQNGTYKVIGDYDYNSDKKNWYNIDIWEGGSPPADRTIIRYHLLKISRPLLYVMVALALVGVIFTISAILFNMCSLGYSVVANSLPYMNTLIACGCIVCLACVPLFGIDGEWESLIKYTSFCQIRTWMMVMGFTISYGTMFVKVFYSWRLSKRAQSKPSNKTIISLVVPTWKPYIVLATLLALDIILLATWQGWDPLIRTQHEVDVKLAENEEDGVIKYIPLLERCSCHNMNIWIGVTYGYKGCLLIVGLFLAYETRSVKIRAINDLKFIAMAVYNIVVLCLIAVPVTLIIPNQHNARFGFISVAIIISCYLTVGLLFIPKMVPIISNRLDMDEQETQKTLLHHENEKRYEELKGRNDKLKQQIAQKEKQIQDLHSVLQNKFSTQLTNEEQAASDSAFSEDNSNNSKAQDLSET